MQPVVPRSIEITICYDRTLEKITEKSQEVAWVSEGMLFLQLLAIIFRSYPEIEKRYPAGVLGFVVNGVPPPEFAILEDGDWVEFSVVWLR